jgi:hypothetical protein
MYKMNSVNSTTFEQTLSSYEISQTTGFLPEAAPLTFVNSQHLNRVITFAKNMHKLDRDNLQDAILALPLI